MATTSKAPSTARSADTTVQEAPAGLTSAEAAERLNDVGPNEIAEQKQSLLREIGTHFWGPIPWMIEVTVALTAAVGHWADFGIISALLLVNGAVGFWEEHQAGSAIAALKESLAASARVLRDDTWQTIPARLLVPGDLVHVQLGQIVPADANVVSGTCEVDQSALTGESLPVTKQPTDELYSGSVVMRGEASARVAKTGARTLFGQSATLVGAEPPPSHFQRAVLQIGRALIGLALSLVACIVAASLIRGDSVSTTLEFALVVTIASVPVALPAVLSVTMAVGARTLARRQAVVSHLPAVEELAGVDVLCSDKTGTITKNQLSLAEAVVLEPGADSSGVLIAAAFASQREGDDPIDAAILEAADGSSLAGYATIDFSPFDPEKKRAVAQIRTPVGAVARVAKGAPQAIASLVGDDAARQGLERVVAGLGARGFRALAVARDDGSGWRVLGVLPLHDPPRDDSAETIEAARGLGLTIKMVTGDRSEIAREVAAEVGLGTKILDAPSLRDAGDRLAERLISVDGFAEVVPEDKYRIVEALQKERHIVAMTGDGVNDAPALRRADAGIAVAGATDAARVAADIVLLAPGLSVIVDALRVSREIFRRMTNYTIYRITETIRIVVFVAISILALGFFPVSAGQIVLLALLNDAAILSIAFDRVRSSPLPERWELREILAVSGVLGLVGVAESLSLLLVAQHVFNLDHETLRTLLYLKLSVAGHMTVFVARTRGPFWSVRPARVLFAAVVGTQILATILAAEGILMAPLPWKDVALAWGWAAVWLFVLDAAKLATYRLRRRSTAVSARPAAIA